jgi:hypothetical protein
MFGFAKRPNNLLNPARFARWASTLGEGSSLKIPLPDRAPLKRSDSGGFHEFGGDMKKAFLVSLCLASTSLLHGCLSAPAKWDDSCPVPQKDQVENGYLKIQAGVTLKCQIRKYLSNWSCVGVKDSEGSTDEGLVCGNGKQQAMFLFDENEILKSHKFY